MNPSLQIVRCQGNIKLMMIKFKKHSIFFLLILKWKLIEPHWSRTILPHSYFKSKYKYDSVKEWEASLVKIFCDKFKTAEVSSLENLPSETWNEFESFDWMGGGRGGSVTVKMW